jgi:hypothetical protein
MGRFVLVLLAVLLVPAAPALAWTWPVDGPVLVPFSFGPDPYLGGQHRGIDVGAPTGTAVVAPAGGTVTFAGTVPGGGKTVSIRTSDGYSVTLVHLGSIETAKGSTVAEGDVVGSVGPSGTPDIADPYVYMGVRVSSDPQGYVDPLSLLPPRGPLSPPSPTPAPAPVPAVVESAAVAARPAPAGVTTSTAVAGPPSSGAPSAPVEVKAPAPPAEAAGPPTAAAPTTALTSAEATVPATNESPPEGSASVPADAETTAASTPSIVSDSPATDAQPAATGVDLPVGAGLPGAEETPAVEAAATETNRATASRAARELETTVSGEVAASLDRTAASPPRAVDLPSSRADLAPAPGLFEPVSGAGVVETTGRKSAPAGAIPPSDSALPADVVWPSALGAVRADTERPLPAAPGERLRWHNRLPLPILVFSPLALVGPLLAAVLRRRRQPLRAAGIAEEPARMMERDALLEPVEDDLHRARVAVCERPSPHRPCRRVRRPGGHPRALSPAQGRPRADGQRHGRARYAGHGRRGRRGGVAA